MNKIYFVNVNDLKKADIDNLAPITENNICMYWASVYANDEYIFSKINSQIPDEIYNQISTTIDSVVRIPSWKKHAHKHNVIEILSKIINHVFNKLGIEGSDIVKYEHASTNHGVTTVLEFNTSEYQDILDRIKTNLQTFSGTCMFGIVLDYPDYIEHRVYTVQTIKLDNNSYVFDVDLYSFTNKMIYNKEVTNTCYRLIASNIKTIVDTIILQEKLTSASVS